MKLFKKILTVLVLLCVSATAFAQETEAEIKENANKLFEKEQYVKATALYLRLISLHPEDYDYNYRYGTCLLFNADNKKKNALRYLTYAITSSSADPRAYYFRGRALHLNYQFKDAKKMYREYKKRRSSKDKGFDVDREIEMCDNGKRLMSNFTDIIVSEKKQIDEDKFFRLYHDMQIIGGDILVTERFQSKMDKKMGHVPIVHFPKNATSVYYSSYGEKGETGLDIYVRKKLLDGNWGEPQMLTGEVNTPYDDNFPYLHPSGQYLYFSSKGHNSMGGYDVFMARFDPTVNGFMRTENVDFAICSPDDDLFYVVDSSYQNAYFASARQSEEGKLHVYRVRVARIPIQEVFIMGDFLSEINPENKDMTVTIFAGATGNEIGVIKSNAKGKYSYVFPQGGKYTYKIKIDGIDGVTEIDLDLPFLDEFRPLKQRVIHKQTPEGEVVMIENLFDELIEGGSELIGPILRKKAELDINLNDFDAKVLAALDLAKKRDEILADLGYDGLSPREVQNQLNELAIAERDQNENIKKMSDGIDQNIINTSLDLNELVDAQQELINRAAATDDPVEKYEHLKEAKKIGAEIITLTDQIAGLNKLKSTIQSEFGNSDGRENIQDLSTKFDELIKARDEEDAWNILALNQSEIFEIRNSSPKAMIAYMIDESIELRKKQNALRERNNSNTANISQLEADISLLKGQLPGAKKKQRKELEEEILFKTQELEAYIEDQAFSKADIAAIDREANVLDENVDVLQESITGSLVATISVDEVEAALKAASKIENEGIDKQIETDIEALENNYPEITSAGPAEIPTQENVQNKLEASHAEAVSQIISNSEQTELEKLTKLIANNEATIDRSTSEIQALQIKLEGDPENMDLLEEQTSLVQYLTKLEDENEGFRNQVDQINIENPPVAISKEDLVEGLLPGFNEEVRSIKTNTNLNEEEQLDQLQVKTQKLDGAVNERLNDIRTQLESDPTKNELLAQLDILESVRAENTEEIARIDARLRELTSTTVATESRNSEIIEEILPGHESNMNAIASNNELQPLDRLTQQQTAEEELLTSTNQKIKVLDAELTSNPNDPVLLKRKDQLEEIASTTSNTIDERAQEINALTNVSSIVDLEGIKTRIQESIAGTRESDIAELRNSSGTAGEISIGVWDLEQEYLDRLVAEASSVNQRAEANPENQEAQTEVQAIKELIEAQENEVAAQRIKAFEDAVTVTNNSELIAGVDRKYSIEMGELFQESPRDNDAIAEREADLQNKLQKELDKKRKELDRSYSVNVDLEWMLLDKELTESKKREEIARAGTEVIAVQRDQEGFIEEIRNTLLSENATEVSTTYTEKEELETQDEVLQAYENGLITELSILEAQQLESPSEQTVAKIDWVKEELETIRNKRGSISISLDEFGTEVIAANVSIESDPTLAKLENDEAALVKQLDDPNLSTSEREQIKASIQEVQTAQVEHGNEITSESIDESQEEQEALTNALLNNGGPTRESPLIASAIDASVEERKVIDQLVNDADNAKSSQEREYLLDQAETRQKALVESLEDIVQNQQVNTIEENEGITIYSEADLQERKRRYTIQIGDFDTQLFQIDEQISEAKRREIPELEDQRANLILQRDRAAQQLKEVNSQIENLPVEETIPRIASAALEQDVSFNEEREIAVSEEYAAYRIEGIKALELENQARAVENELVKEREDLLAIISGVNPELSDMERQEYITLRTNRIKTLESELEQINSDLAIQTDIADKLLPTNAEEAMKIQNLLARGVRPLKVVTAALALIQMPSTGLAINETMPSIYSEANPIPVGVESPSGLTYRVQIGAFARAIPQDLFKEFNPVSGEKIGNTGITRYMAGFFNNSDSVVTARQQIRSLGYRDAFVVAYCDGERITFGEARRREAAGTCVPKVYKELMMEVAENTADHLGIPLTNEVKEVPEYTYNLAPGAIPADPIELKKGLFFSVQIGVFNRPVSEKRLKNMPDILTIRLPTGQIRYSTGMFDSASGCKSRKIEAYESGIEDAFIVAYYNGVRIKVYEANDLLAKYGPSILQSNIDESEPVVIVETPSDIIRTDTVVTEVIEVPVDIPANEEIKVQVVTKQTFDAFPRDILNRYNTEGNFYYDANDGKVKSVIYDNENMLPRLFKFEEDIDTVYLSSDALAMEMNKTTLQVQLATETVPGDLVDLVLRLPYPREFVKVGKGLMLTIEGIEPTKLLGVQNQVRMIGLEPVVLETINEN